MTVAFVPLRLARVMVTAGYSPRSGVVRRPRGIGVQNVVLRLGRAVDNLRGHVAQVHRLALIDANHHLLQVVGLAQKTSRFNLELLIALREASGDGARIGACCSCAATAPAVIP